MLTLPPSLFTFRKIALAAVSFMSLASMAVAAGPHAETNPFERSTFSDDWGVLNNDIFFGGVEALFGLSPASRTLRLSETTESKTTSESYAIVNAAGSTESLFSFASAVASPFAMGRTGGGPVPNAITAAKVWDGGLMGGGLSWTASSGVNWSPDGIPASGDTLTLDNSIVNIPTTMQIGANLGALSVTFANGFNPTNTTTIGSNAGTSPIFTFDPGWSLTNNATSGVVTFNPTVSGGSSPLSFALNGAGTVTVASGGTIAWNTVIADGTNAGAITKTGAGILVLTGNNTYTGATTISGGALRVSGAPSNQALGGTSGVTVNSGGTLLQTTSNQINNGADMTLDGGIYKLDGGVSEGTTGAAGLGSLTLASNSIINLAGIDLLHFDASSLETWAPGSVLSIYNWNGTPITGGGAEQILFGTGPTGLNALQLVSIQFYSGEGTGAFAPGAVILANGEIVPVPEPSTWIGGALALAALGVTRRRRLRGQGVRRAQSSSS